MGKYSNLLSEEVKEQIEILLESGAFKANDPLPSERELAEQFDVNRQTVRTALKRLRNEHRIYTQHGKGNFVSPRKYCDDTSRFSSFTSGWEADGYTTYSRTLLMQVIEAPLAVSTMLDLPLGTEVYQLRRVRYIGDEPLSYETSYVPVKMCEGLDRFDFNHSSLYDTMEKVYGISLTTIDEKISITTLNDDERAELEADNDDLAFCFKSVTLSKDRVPVECCVAVVRADKMYLVSYMEA